MYGELPVGEIVPSTQVGNSGMPSQGSSISTGRNLESGSITELKSSKVAGFSRSKEARGESVLPVKVSHRNLRVILPFIYRSGSGRKKCSIWMMEMDGS